MGNRVGAFPFLYRYWWWFGLDRNILPSFSDLVYSQEMIVENSQGKMEYQNTELSGKNNTFYYLFQV
jgi:hypothetical protein